MKYQCVADCRYEFPINLMCRLLRIKPSGYYAWSRRPLSRRSQENGRLRKKIVEIHVWNVKELYAIQQSRLCQHQERLSPIASWSKVASKELTGRIQIITDDYDQVC